MVPVLRAFVVTAELEHLTAAAESLQMSASTLSRQLARLQIQMGERLFEHEGRRIVLTDAGRRVATAGRAALDVLAAASPAEDTRTGAKSAVRFAFLRTLGVRLIPDLLAGFCAQWPMVELNLQQSSTAMMLDQLISGRLDLAMVSPPPDRSDFSTMVLVRQPLEAVLPPEHRLAGTHALHLADIASDRLILLQRGYGTRTTVDMLAACNDLTISPAYEADDTDLARGMVAAGLGTAILPSVGEYHLPDVARVRIADEGAHRTVALSWPRNRELPPAAGALRDHIKASFRA